MLMRDSISEGLAREERLAAFLRWRLANDPEVKGNRKEVQEIKNRLAWHEETIAALQRLLRLRNYPKSIEEQKCHSQTHLTER